MLIPYLTKSPEIYSNVFIAYGAVIVGDVVIGPNCSCWYNCVVRGDGGKIVVGPMTNIQDNATVHCLKGGSTTIGSSVSIGHNAVVHGCVLEDRVLVGAGACVMDGAILRSGVVVGAGAVIQAGRECGPGLYVGVPAIWKPLTQDLDQLIDITAQRYVEYARQYLGVTNAKG